MVDKATLPMPHPPTYSGTVRPVEGHEDDGRIVEVYDPEAQDAVDGWVRVTRPGVHQRPAEEDETPGAAKPFSRMNHAELDAEAFRRGITFVADMTSKQKVAVLEGAN